MTRRDAARLLALGAGLVGAGPGRAATGRQRAGRQRAERATKPPRLRPGDTVGLCSPAGISFSADDLAIAEATFAALGLRVVFGEHVLARHGYLAGTDRERADDVTALFARDDVQAVIPLRGGWGCARILPHLDYETIRATPKVLCGFSDVTSLLTAVHRHAGLVTFHGPNGISNFSAFTTARWREVVLDAATPTLSNPPPAEDALVPRRTRTLTVQSGRARGPLVGGNLTVLSALVGTPYAPETDGRILFVEDVGEAIYRVDRMLTQLGQAGLLDGIAGFVFGACARCDADSGGLAGFTLEEVVRHHAGALGVPAVMGLDAVGHTAQKVTVPLGVEAEVDADAGTIRLLEPAVA